MRAIHLLVLCWVAQLCLTLQPHGLQPTRLLCPWDSPGKNTGVCCQFLLFYLTALGLSCGMQNIWSSLRPAVGSFVAIPTEFVVDSVSPISKSIFSPEMMFGCQSKFFGRDYIKWPSLYSGKLKDEIVWGNHHIPHIPVSGSNRKAKLQNWYWLANKQSLPHY